MAISTAKTSGEGERLAKVVAAQLPCSRREAEQYITEGWVQVDGQVASTPQQRVFSHQRVEVDSKARLGPAISATFLVHKPAGLSAETVGAMLAEAGNKLVIADLSNIEGRMLSWVSLSLIHI